MQILETAEKVNNIKSKDKWTRSEMFDFFQAMKEFFLPDEWEQFIIYWNQDTDKVSEIERKTLLQWSSILTIDLLEWLEPADFRSELCKIYPERRTEIFKFNYDDLEKYYWWLHWKKATHKNNGIDFEDLISGAIWKDKK